MFIDRPLAFAWTIGRECLTSLGFPALLVLAIVAVALVIAESGTIPSTAPIDFIKADLITGTASPPSSANWLAISLPTALNSDGLAPPRGVRTMWVRLRFGSAAFPPGPLGVIGQGIRDDYVAFLNGHELDQNGLDDERRDFAWNGPHWLLLPQRWLKPGTNELTYRITGPGTRPLMLGKVRLGPAESMRAAYTNLYRLDVVSPQVINGVLALLSTGALLCWFVRPQEQMFGWLILLGVLWWFYNLQGYVSTVPIGTALFWALSKDSIFALMAGSYGFAASYFQMSDRRPILLVSLCCLGALISRHILVACGLSDVPSYLLGLPIAGITLALLTKACWRNPKAENFLMLIAMLLSAMFGVNDLGLFKHLWPTTSFHLMPFGSLLVFSAFGMALCRRVLDALVGVEAANLTLKQRVADATASLALSEAARRQLEVAGAIKIERERLMREIHDGIGSSLITALAVAERQHQPANAIATLKRSIADLRIAVDSLEPIEGDVVMLLASLRYRMERELRDAGLTFVWSVTPAPPLEWLDAVGALHVLRILQEAIGNVLMHACAKLVQVDCRMLIREGRAGVLVAIRDDGRGFDPAASVNGRGLANMHARAEALHASLSIVSSFGLGTELVLWLPIAQHFAANDVQLSSRTPTVCDDLDLGPLFGWSDGPLDRKTA